MDTAFTDISNFVNSLVAQAGAFVSSIFDGMPIGMVIASVAGCFLLIVFILALFDAL